MVARLAHFPEPVSGTIRIPGSKSISNRVLIIHALCTSDFPIKGLSEAQDTQTLIRLLETRPPELDAGPAGTTYRFLTAFLALQSGVQVLTGSQRMKERPIGLLVEALRQLGARIRYLEKEGYPPLEIQGFDPAGQQADELIIPASTSSQFISALLLIAPSLPKGLSLKLEGEVVSRPYIQMTMSIMAHFGAVFQWEKDVISVEPGVYQGKPFLVESDWSAASYYYALAALAPEADIRVSRFQPESVQGDSILAEFMTAFGVQTTFGAEGIRLVKPRDVSLPDRFQFDFLECPDIAQTLAVVCAGLGVPARLEGLRTLRVKETDRIKALIRELAKVKVGASSSGDDVLELKGKARILGEPRFNTYEDHRMAMAFAPLACLGAISIEDPEVTGKSYPTFWEDLNRLGIQSRMEPDAGAG